MDHYEMLRKVSRTFALSIEQLPQVLRDSITASYLLLRVSDCLEDHDTMPPERKAELLRLWAQVLSNHTTVESLTKNISDLDSSDPEVYVAQHAGQVIKQLHTLPPEIQQAIVKHVNRTSMGMAWWQEHGPYVENEQALDDYMHQVAGRVGYLLTDIFAWYSPIIRERKEQLMPLSRQYGLALQTVNIIRGMRKDYERGWVFVPRTFYERVGLTRDTLFAPDNLDKAMQVVDMLADKAERHLWHGMTYITAFPRYQHRIRLACMWPLFFAVRTLAISRNNANVLIAEAKMGRQQVSKIMRDTSVFGWSNHWLVRYYRYLARQPAKSLLQGNI
ncbi:MAG: squalene/phytoene synthase family protein [Anaerolineae bacterium]|nr:squalene/phytoene synthase family protein [Anaerolineae bacterium]